MYDNTKPSNNQIKFALSLLRDLGYDPDDYDVYDMSRKELSALIAELKDERDGQGGRDNEYENQEYPAGGRGHRHL